jgi:CheY-like chemotaxis protein
LSPRRSVESTGSDTSFAAAASTRDRQSPSDKSGAAERQGDRPASGSRFGVVPTSRFRNSAGSGKTSDSSASAAGQTSFFKRAAATPAPSPSAASSAKSSAPRTLEQSMLDIFADSGSETMARIRTHMRAYSKDPNSEQGKSHLQNFYRLVHSLSSVSAMASLESIANFSACLEAYLHELMSKPGAFQPSTLRTLASAVDVLGRMFKESGKYESPMMTEAFVLVVDDDVVSQRAVTLSLQKARLSVICASNCDEAFEKLKEISFELVVLDVNMPGLDGFELCTAIRKIPTYEHTPILFVSGLNDFLSRAKSVSSGGNDFISKPLSRIEMTIKSLSFVMKGRLPAHQDGARPALV